MNALTQQAVPPGIPAVLNSGGKPADTGAGLALIVAAVVWAMAAAQPVPTT